METELLTICDRAGVSIGEATREEVHKKGYWHKTFQCYVIGIESDAEYMYIQLRSQGKKDFANLYDITAAGHILSNESVEEGVREVNEELGLNVSSDELLSLGIIPNIIITENIRDYELSHVFLYEMNEPMDTFILQQEEVSGIAKAPLREFIDFFNGKLEHIVIEGYRLDLNSEKNWFSESITRENFVPHSTEYFLGVAKAISEVRFQKDVMKSN